MKSQPSPISGITMEHKLAAHMVVFSHGFGVGRDGGGLLSELATNLPKTCGYVLFDYNDFDGQLVHVSDFSEQVRRLKAVIEWTQKQPGVTDVSVLAHSMGCITVALTKPNINGHFVFIAPPVVIGERTRTYFTSKPGAKQRGNHWVLPRSDGTSSIVPNSLIDEFEKVNAKKALLNFAERQRYALVTAGNDEILGEEDYSTLSAHLHVDFVTILDADHNFQGTSRKKLIALIKRLLL